MLKELEELEKEPDFDLKLTTNLPQLILAIFFFTNKKILNGFKDGLFLFLSFFALKFL